MLNPASATANRRKRQKGEGLLEAALVFTTLMCMLFFIVEMGRLLFIQQYFGERARAGARWAAANTFDQTKIKAVVCFNDPSNAGTVGYFGLPTSNVTASSATVNGRTAITVSISGYRTPMMIPWIARNVTMPPAVATAFQ